MEQTNQLKSIALIDDDAVTNMINTKIISRSFPANIVSYTNARESLDKFGGEAGAGKPVLPDFIFLDINMPGMDGWEFLAEFQNFPADRIKGCKIYMLTSSIDLDDIEKSKQFASVLGFISKPLTQDKLSMLS